MLPDPINLQRWIDEHRHLLKPPVGNKCIVDGDFIVMIVGGPNARTDYHFEEGPEWFFQLEGEMVLRVQEPDAEGRLQARDIPIRAGETFYLPPRVPHEDDALMWFCVHCNHKVYEEFFHLIDIEQDFFRVFERFYRDDALRTCTQCGTLNPRPSRYELAADSRADIT